MDFFGSLLLLVSSVCYCIYFKVNKYVDDDDDDIENLLCAVTVGYRPIHCSIFCTATRGSAPDSARRGGGHNPCFIEMD